MLQYSMDFHGVPTNYLNTDKRTIYYSQKADCNVFLDKNNTLDIEALT